MADFRDLSGAELRLELAEAEALKPATIKSIWHKRDRIKALTHELVERGCF